jgi:hypothetical protein
MPFFLQVAPTRRADMFKRAREVRLRSVGEDHEADIEIWHVPPVWLGDFAVRR